MTAVATKYPRRRENMYRPEPDLLMEIKRRYPGAPLEYDSVTAALRSGVPKPELAYWMIGEAARRPIEDPWTFDSVDKVRRDMDASLDAAADRGKTIHSWVEAHARGAVLDVTSVPDQFQGYARAFERWAQTVSWKQIVFTEANIYSVKHRYAGTSDLALVDPLGMTTLFDFKTNARARVYRDTGLQLKAYQSGDFLVKDGRVHDMPVIDGMTAIGLGPDGNWTPWTFNEDLDDFLAALRMYRWKKRGER